MSADECVFCAIIDGEIPSHTVYESDMVYAFLDVNPLAAGHTLVIPRTHRERLQDLTDEEAAALWTTVNDIVPAVEMAVDADATTVGVNNGEASGQEVPHSHVHIIPRFGGDGGKSLHAVGGPPPSLGDDELATIATAISDTVEG